MKAVVLAAGKGTRMKPITDTVPKVMIDINGKPMLQIILEQLKSVGITEIVVITHYLEEKIKDYFGDGAKSGLSLTYVKQGEMKGTGDAVLHAAPHINGPFLCIAGDSLFETSLLTKLMHHTSDGVISCREVEDTKPWGILQVEGNKVLKMVEKPDDPPSNLANFSVYLFPHAIFDACRQIQPSKRGEYEINDAIHMLIDEGKVFEYEKSNRIVDIGTPEQYEKAKELAKELGL